MLNIVAGLLNGAGAPASTTSYESISTITVGSGGTSSISFTSIPSTYKHLQIRFIGQSNRSTYGRDSVQIRFNSDSGTNYSSHELGGDGASAYSAVGGTSNNQGYVSGLGTTTAGASFFGGGVVDILDYANTNKYKTVRSLGGQDCNGTVGGAGGVISLISDLWLNTSAITSIYLAPNSGTLFSQNSSFALYGIKG